MVLTTGEDGFVSSNSNKEQGLWCFQTRLLSRYRWLINGKPPQPTAVSAIEQHRSMAYYLAKPAECRTCDPAQQAIELKLTREVGNGLVEGVAVTNFTQKPTRVQLELEAQSDFADPSGKPVPHQRSRHWERSAENEWTLTVVYRAHHRFSHQGDRGVARVERGLRLSIKSNCEPHRVGRRIRFEIHLRPHETWRAQLEWSAGINGEWLFPITPQQQESEGASFATANPDDLSASVQRTLDRARADLFALRLHDLNRPGTWVAAAGAPSYLAFFGRDSIATGMAGALFTIDLARGALAILTAYQGQVTDDWRDEQPGRMVHELHTNPRAVLNYTPHARYYGDITASLQFPALVANVWRWTGMREAVEPYLEPALRALGWADQNALLCGDGFYRYKTRSSQGEKNQGWKDSADAVVYEDGTQVPDPLGTCEMQGLVYASKQQLAEVLEAFGRSEEAAQLTRQAAELKAHFNRKFWMPEEHFFAMGLDSKGRLIRSIASDAGHCLASGIIEEERAGAVVQRLMQDDLFSGWGVRSLSARHPAFNPYAYHRGTVWPVESGIFIFGMARYGFRAEANRLAKALFETAALFQHGRLPEVLGGHPRDPEHSFPGMYPRANAPQAWSATAPFLAIQAMLGIRPDAPHRMLFVNPQLPDWLPELRITNLEVGGTRIDLLFQGRGWHVEKVEGEIEIRAEPDVFEHAACS